MILHYWFMLPISILIATIAMASGVGGATFFSPLFILALGFPPDVAIGIGLITEVFGFASGLYAYARKRLIDYRLGLNLLMATIPAALIGSFVGGSVDPDILKAILGVGGLFVGLISTGLGELNGYFLLQRCRVPSKVSVATSVFVVAITVLFASTAHFFQFTQAGSDVLQLVLNVVIFTVPGVIIGGQLGTIVASRISQRTMETGVAVLFILVGALTLGEVIL